MKSNGWGTWIRTRTNGVRVRGSTVNLFPKTHPAGGSRPAFRGALIAGRTALVKPKDAQIPSQMKPNTRAAVKPVAAVNIA